MKRFFTNFKGDFLGGITAGIVALPLALAFGVSSGLGPSAGLYGAIFLSIFAAMFGGTPSQISGPTAPMTAVTMVLVAGIVSSFDGVVEDALPVILMVFFMAAVFQVALGLFRLGTFIKYIPYPVVSGFMTAIGVIILITQIFPMLGYYPREDEELMARFKPFAEEVILEKILREEAGEGILVLEDFRETTSRAEKITPEHIEIEASLLAESDASGVKGTIKYMGRSFRNIQWLELLLGLATIFIIYGFKRITTAVPSTLVALLIVSAIAYFTGLDYRPIREIPQGLPLPHLEIFTEFDMAGVTPYIFTAFTLSLLGAIDSLLTSIVADNLTKTRHEPNKELVGQGIGNGLAAFFGGIPGAGATIRTVVNIQSGGRTRLSGIIAGILLLAILLSLGPVASKIPAAVLAGILITVGIGVMDYRGLRAMRSMPSGEVFIMLIVLVLSVVWNLVYAVGIGLILASLLFMKKMGDQAAANSKVERLPKSKLKKLLTEPDIMEKVMIKKLEGPLFFGFTKEFHDLSEQIPSDVHWVIIRMEKVPYIDQSGVYALESVVKQLAGKSIKILFSGLRKDPLTLMEKANIFKGLDNDIHFFKRVEDALGYIREKTT